MNKIIITTIFTMLSGIAFNVSAVEGKLPANGPHAITTLLDCKLKDGNTLNLMKNDSMYYGDIRDADESVVYQFEAKDNNIFQSRTDEADATGHKLDGRFISIPNGTNNSIFTLDTTDGVKKVTVRYNVDMSSKAEYEAECVPNTIKGNMMDDSLFANIPN